MARFNVDNHFRIFANNLEGVLLGYEAKIDPDEDLLVRQREQIRGLVDAETRLRTALQAHPWGRGVYRDFLDLICNKKGNILAARPYFRERQVTFTRHISKALKTKNIDGLFKWRFNWSFVDFLVSCRKWPANGKIAKLVKEIKDRRKELLEQNLPLAISQARIFWGSTPKSHLTYMDIVQIQCQGLLLAIDKFVPPNEKRMSDKASLAAYQVFRAVAIGIMRRDRVNAYSETLIHFYPKDRAKQYRANKLLRVLSGVVDRDALAERVNEALDDPKCRTDGEDLAGLLAAASTVSGDQSLDPDGDTVLESYADTEALNPEDQFEAQESLDSMKESVLALSLRDRKLLRLKGVKTHA